ncbi:protein kinase domain-containing protein [Colwellia sp. MEBiC06753]
MGSDVDKYTRLKLLGEGGMGKVFLAKDNQLNRHVAIKLLTCNRLASSTESSLQEARMLARVNHNNIIQIYHVFEEKHQLSLVMEYFNGKSLSQYYREKILTIEQKLTLLIQLSEGLATAHKNEVIHCDLKPSNILVDEQGQLKITDFGIAQLASESEQENYRVQFGCLSYMSPEQITHQPVDYRTDIFSLGIIAYELIVGSHPFSAGSTSDLATAICNQEVIPPQQLLKDIPSNLAELMLLMLSKKTTERIISAKEIAHRLKHIQKALIHSDLIAQQTVPIVEQSIATKPTKLSKKLLAGFTLLVAIVAGAVSWHYLKKPETKYVLVLKPEMLNEEHITVMQKEQVLYTIEDALRQSVINTNSMYLISHKEINRVKQFGAEELNILKQAVGATDVIKTELDCNNNRCNAIFSRLASTPNHPTQLTVKKEQHWVMPIEKFNDIFSTSQTQFAMIFPENNDINDGQLIQRAVREEDYQQYIDLYYRVREQGEFTNENLQALEHLIQKSPYFYALYPLYGEVALHLFVNLSDANFLERFEVVLDNAPSVYKASKYHAIDRFWLASYQKKLDEVAHRLKDVKAQGAYAFTVLELEGYYYFQQSEYAQAIEKYKEALKLRPSITLQYNLAVSYLRVGAFKLASEQISKLRNILPQNIRFKRLDAQVSMANGDLENAINIYQQLVIESDAIRDLNNLALAYTLNGSYQKALKYAELALTKAPTSKVRLLNLADIEMFLGHKQKALDYYQQVIVAPDDNNKIKNWMYLAQAYIHTGEEHRALEALENAKSLNNYSGELAYSYAIVSSILGEEVSAIYSVKASLESGMGVVWFNLPWFDKLCENKQFLELMSEKGNAKRCFKS